MITHSYLDKSGLSKIGIWEDGNEIVAMSTYDTRLGEGFFCVFPRYGHLKREMLRYAKENLAKDGRFRASIPDSDAKFQDIASLEGFIPTQERECDAVYPIDLRRISYRLPDGFRITSMAEDYDYRRYKQALWRGFNHPGDMPYTDEQLAEQEIEMKRPNVNLDLKIAVVAPNGDFVSYCGMWHDAASSSALVEPVATDPDYRKLGLGKAAVLEGIRRCGLLGADKAFVGSSQQFYYNIGFRPCLSSTWWESH
jgi:GNAT superfamily N-acetyltransferase